MISQPEEHRKKTQDKGDNPLLFRSIIDGFFCGGGRMGQRGLGGIPSWLVELSSRLRFDRGKDLPWWLGRSTSNTRLAKARPLRGSQRKSWLRMVRTLIGVTR